MASEQFSLCWDNFHRNMSSGMNSLLENEDLVDVTLAVEGRYLKAHKMVLSVCSPYFKDLFKTNPCQHPIVFMKDVSYVALSDLLQFMYQGEVQVSQENLSTFIKTAEALQIKGLTGDGSGTNENDVDPPKQSSQIVSDYKTSVTSPIPSRTKKVPANSSYSAPIPKRQRVSTGPSSVTSGPDVQIVNSPITKTEPIEHKSNTDMVQFKMEPYDSTQSIKISDIDDTFEEGFEETGVDDAEDYTMMEGGEEEPQAGTSTEGTGEGQDDKEENKYLMKKRKPNMPRYIVDGFVFHVNITKGNPPMIYLRCLEYKRLGCHARAVLPYDGSIEDIMLKRPHNHPPDHTAEEKILFMRELKEVMLKNPTVPSRTIYATLSEMYPNAARETPFDCVRHKMNRWRRQNEEHNVTS